MHRALRGQHSTYSHGHAIHAVSGDSTLRRARTWSEWMKWVKSLSRVRLCDPMNCSLPGSSIHGFSRQEYWSGLPFPSPMHEREKWKWSRSVMSWLLATPWTAAYQAPPSMDFPGKSTGVGCHCLLRTISWGLTKSDLFSLLEARIAAQNYPCAKACSR